MESRSKEQAQLSRKQCSSRTISFLYSVLNTTSDLCLFHITSDLKITQICIVLDEGSEVSIALRGEEQLVFSSFGESKTIKIKILFTEVRSQETILSFSKNRNLHVHKDTQGHRKSINARTQQCHASLTYYKAIAATRTTAGSRAVQSGNSAFKSVPQIHLNYTSNTALIIRRQNYSQAQWQTLCFNLTESTPLNASRENIYQSSAAFLCDR